MLEMRFKLETLNFNFISLKKIIRTLHFINQFCLYLIYFYLFRFIADCTEKTLDAYLWAAQEYQTTDQVEYSMINLISTINRII